ncbi:hypothetical protein KBA41_17900, partial [Candidatus Ozemobacteraceae bacterium]|nr:hypothetical protein [Candidatus Ozemobacteraceae bacterium]
MPFLRLTSSAPETPAKAAALAEELSQAVSRLLGKPETYVMVAVGKADMRMSGTDEPSAFIELRSIGGFSTQKNKAISEALSGIVTKHLGVSGSRIFLNFM